MSLITAGEIHIASGNLSLALQAFTRALDASTMKSDSIQQINSRIGMAWVTLRLGDIEEAFKHIQWAEHLLDLVYSQCVAPIRLIVMTAVVYARLRKNELTGTFLYQILDFAISNTVNFHRSIVLGIIPLIEICLSILESENVSVCTSSSFLKKKRKIIEQETPPVI